VPGAAALPPLADVVPPKETEATPLTGITVADISTARQAARRLLKMGVRRAAVVTLGALGSVVATADGEFHLPALPVAARDTPATGEACDVVLAADMAAGAIVWPHRGVTSGAAGLSVTRLGAMNSLPARAEVEAALPGPEPIRL